MFARVLCCLPRRYAPCHRRELSLMKISVLLRALLFVLSVCVSSSCVDDQSTSSVDFDQVRNSVWRLFSFDTTGVPGTIIFPADTILLWFDTPNRLRGTGKGLCVNEYAAVCNLGPFGSIRFDSINTTKRGCSPGSRYGDYWNQLHDVSSYSVSTVQLCLYYNSSRSRMIFTRIP